jgi:putative ABC transport system permease protein
MKTQINFAIKSLFKHKVFTLINIFGLALGLSVAIAISTGIVITANIDQYHENRDVYKLAHTDVSYDRFSDASSALLAPTIMDAFPEVTDYCQFFWADNILLGTGDNHVKEAGYYIDEGWFRMLSFPLIHGDPNHVLSNPNNIVLSEKLSAKLFGEENPVGKTIYMYSAEAMEPHVFTISGVFKDVPFTSTFQFEFAIPFEWYINSNSWLQTWDQIGTRSYIQVTSGTDIEELNHKITDLVKSKNPNMKDTQIFRLVPLHKSHNTIYTLSGDFAYGFYIMLALGIVGFLILFISIINYINLSLATSLKRAKEIGTKKVHGASRKDLIFQFFLESFIVVSTSMLLASFLQIYLMKILLPTESSYSFLLNKNILMVMGGLLIFTVGATTWYPAVYLSKFSPITLQQKITVGRSKFSFGRNFLVTIQFVAAIILVSTSLVLSKQVDYLLNQSMGMDRYNTVFFTRNMPIEKHRNAFTQELMRKPGIESVTFSNQIPYGISSSTTSVIWKGKDHQDQSWYSIINVGDNFATTMKIKLLEGNDFSDGIQNQVLVNRAAVEIMQLDDPLGAILHIYGTERVIVGVLDNFKHQVFNDPNTPVFVIHDPANTDKVFVRLTENNQLIGLNSLQEVFNQFSPDFILDYTFLDQQFNQIFDSYKKIGRLMSVAGLLAVIIACIGLLGLTVHSSERRIKELGVRKINGAGMSDILILLSSQIIQQILIAAAVAFPIAFFVNKVILQNFPDRTPITLEPFIYSLFILVGLASLIMGWHVVWVARRNPVEALRFE